MSLNLFVDDMLPGPNNIFALPPKNWEDWVVVRSVDNAQELLRRGIVDDLSLDCDMGVNSLTGENNRSGIWLARWMMRTKCWPKGKVIAHSSNNVAAQEIMDFVAKWRK